MVPSYQTVARLMYYRIQYSYYYYSMLSSVQRIISMFFVFFRFYMEVVDSFLVMTVIPVKH